MPRPDVNDYFMTLAMIASTRGTCPRRKVGAVLVSADKRVISTGYNGAPPKFQDCTEGGCVMVDGHCVNTIHAEENCLMRAREVGAALYSTDAPCISCLKAALSHNSQVVIYYLRDYVDTSREAFMLKHGLGARLIPMSFKNNTMFHKVAESIGWGK